MISSAIKQRTKSSNKNVRMNILKKIFVTEDINIK